MKNLIFIYILILSGCVANQKDNKPTTQQKLAEKKVSWLIEKTNKSSTDFKFDWVVNTRSGSPEGAYLYSRGLILNMTSKEIEDQIKHECNYLMSSLTSMYNIFNLYNSGRIDWDQTLYRISNNILRHKHEIIYSSPVLYDRKTYQSLAAMAMNLSKGDHKIAPQKFAEFRAKCEKEIGYVKYENFIMKQQKYGTNY